MRNCEAILGQTDAKIDCNSPFRPQYLAGELRVGRELRTEARLDEKVGTKSRRNARTDHQDGAHEQTTSHKGTWND